MQPHRPEHPSTADINLIFILFIDCLITFVVFAFLTLPHSFGVYESVILKTSERFYCSMENVFLHSYYKAGTNYTVQPRTVLPAFSG